MKLALILATVIAGCGLLLSACGSGDGDADEDVSTGTVRSERADREASIMQQEQGADQPAEAGADSGVIAFGHREGLPFARNVVGDPDAPVLIVEYSDFQ
ncbi:MAG: hypothetical protein F4X58_08410 [Chloroflexi bacterium]|nr:hypothetical protein [Chloroflexota bacterium]MYC01932.1 hypothetical protein [Chloroflexota bacterium]